MNTNDADASIISSGRLNIFVTEGYLSSNVYVGSRWRSTEPTLIPLGAWIHLILWWDGNKLRLYINNEEAAPAVNAKEISPVPPLFILEKHPTMAMAHLMELLMISGLRTPTQPERA